MKLKRLRSGIQKSYKAMEKARAERIDAIKQYVGVHYGPEGADKKVPLNLLELAISIYLRQLAAKAPRVLCSTRFVELRPTAANLELALNHLIQEIDLESSQKSVVLNAMFGIGVMKIGLERAYEVEVDGVFHDIGQPFADSVDLDDFVFDHTAKRWEQCAYIGDKYKFPVDFVRSCELYNKEAREKVKPGLAEGIKAQAQASNISQAGAKVGEDDFEDKVELWDIYLPRENRILTLVAGQPDLPPLIDEQWQGPECGPYLICTFGEVPNNLYPLPPVAVWRDLHDLCNAVFRKLGRQAERQKTLLMVQKGGEFDGKQTVNADDGEAIAVQNPANVKETRLGGADQMGLAFLLQCKQMFSANAGNLEILGGLSPQSQTLGQDQLLNTNASKRIAEMQDRTVAFSKKVIRALAWYLWYSPHIEVPLSKPIPGTDLTIPVNFTSEDREGDYLDYNLDINPYSLQDETPSARLQLLNQIITQVLPSVAPFLQAQGGTINTQKLFSMISDLTGYSELDELISFAMPMEPQGEPIGTPPSTKPAVTTRRYERVNRPGATQQGQDQVMAQLAMGGNPQPAEMASLMRPVS